MTDIEIAHSKKMNNITTIANKVGIKKNELELYGNYKAKINKNFKESKSKLILVTAMSPTPLGEGKTTVSVGLGDAIARLNKKTIIALREPSLGPVFGIKGGAAGGGLSQVVPMEDINLHFTGDFHAITSCNNLLSSAIDNHIYQGNELDIKKVLFKRCLDINDRELRNIILKNRNESFTITSASEIMALFCLSTSLEDLKTKLGNIVIGINSKNEYIFARSLHIEGSMAALLKDAIKPNLVQTLEHTPAIIHGGPFANIAHGCNSIIATKTALSLADYVVTEAGFGADLGAEKFLDIKCRKGKLKPNCIVLVATIKALKYHGGVKKEDIFLSNNAALIKGFSNLDRHYNNLKKYGLPIIIALNKFNTDTFEELQIFSKHCEENNMDYSITDAYSKGSKGAVSLANKVINACEENSKFKFLYDENETIKNKISIITKEIYGANNVKYTEEALTKLCLIKKNNLENLPVCIAKTQYSFSDNKDLIGAPSNFEVEVKDINLYNGAGFITVLLGDIMTMPGLSKHPSFEKIDIIDGNIINLS